MLETPREALTALSPTQENIYFWLQNHQDELNRPNPDDFREDYGDEDVNKDLALIEEIKEKQEQRTIREDTQGTQKLSEIFEYIIQQNIELSEWFGSDAFVTAASEFDDKINGIDAIVEFNPEDDPSHLALGIDITFGITDGIKLDKKIQNLKDKLTTGLSTAKYFQSAQTDERMALEHIPKVVVGTNYSVLEELCQLWSDYRNFSKAELSKDPSLSQASRESLNARHHAAQKRLAEHPIQVLLLKQIEFQLETYIEFIKKEVPNAYTDKAEQNMIDGLNKIEVVLGKVREILATKAHIQLDRESANIQEVFTQKVKRMFGDSSKTFRAGV